MIAVEGRPLCRPKKIMGPDKHVPPLRMAGSSFGFAQGKTWPCKKQMFTSLLETIAILFTGREWKWGN